MLRNWKCFCWSGGDERHQWVHQQQSSVLLSLLHVLSPWFGHLAGNEAVLFWHWKKGSFKRKYKEKEIHTGKKLFFNWIIFFSAFFIIQKGFYTLGEVQKVWTILHSLFDDTFSTRLCFICLFLFYFIGSVFEKIFQIEEADRVNWSDKIQLLTDITSHISG